MLSSSFLRLQNSRSVFYESARGRFKVLMLSRAEVDCQLSRATNFNASRQSCSSCSHSLEIFSALPDFAASLFGGLAHNYTFPVVYLFFSGIHPLTRTVVVLFFELIRESCYNI